MKKNLIILSFLLFAYSNLSAQTGKVFVSGGFWPQVALIDKATNEVEWSYDLNKEDECEDIALTPEGNVLISYKGGAKLLSPKKEIIWDYKLTEPGELFTAKQLKDKGFMLAHSGNPAKIIELDKNGVVRKTLTFDTGVEDLHGQLRQIIKSKKGTYLFPIMGTAEIVELDKNGKEIMRFKAEGNPFSITELKNGNLLIPCGDAHASLEVERKTGKLIEKISREDYEGVRLHFVAQIVELKNGNRLVCNWDGHEKPADQNQPTLFEVNKDKKVVWSIYQGKGVGKISCAFAMEDAKAMANFEKGL